MTGLDFYCSVQQPNFRQYLNLKQKQIANVLMQAEFSLNRDFSLLLDRLLTCSFFMFNITYFEGL